VPLSPRLACSPPPAYAQDTEPTPASILAAAPASDWRAIGPADLAGDDPGPDRDGNAREVTIQLLPAAVQPGWVDNIRTLAKAHWWDGTSVYRVVDNWVAQWGDGEDEDRDAKAAARRAAVCAGERVSHALSRPAPTDGRDFVLTPAREEIIVNRWIDSYAVTAFVAGWPIALDDTGGRTAGRCIATVRSA
jgi:peptidylprolyl isomerase